MSAGRRPSAAAALLLLAIGACADTVNPALGGMRIGVEEGPLRLPARLDGEDVFEYPRDAWARRESGTTVLRIQITEEGIVDSVQVLTSSGHASLDSAAMANARKLRFRPAEHGGEPVGVWGRLPVIYPPEGKAPTDARPNP